MGMLTKLNQKKGTHGQDTGAEGHVTVQASVMRRIEHCLNAMAAPTRGTKGILWANGLSSSVTVSKKDAEEALDLLDIIAESRTPSKTKKTKKDH